MLYYDHMGWGWAVLMTLGLLLLLGLVVGVLLSVARERRETTAREILDRRLASGELTVEEYERARAAMSAEPRDGKSAGPPAPA